MAWKRNLIITIILILGYGYLAVYIVYLTSYPEEPGLCVFDICVPDPWGRLTLSTTRMIQVWTSLSIPSMTLSICSGVFGYMVALQ